MTLSREDFRMVDIHLNQELVDILEKNIKRQRLAVNLRLSITRLIDSFNRSPEEFTQKLLDNLSRVKIIKRRNQMVKRITVGFQVDDLSQLDKLLGQLKDRKVKLNRQDLIRFSLLLSFNLE